MFFIIKQQLVFAISIHLLQLLKEMIYQKPKKSLNNKQITNRLIPFGVVLVVIIKAVEWWLI